MNKLFAVAFIAALSTSLSGQVHEADTLKILISSVSRYADLFVATFVGVVAEEHYVQDAQGTGSFGTSGKTFRELKSDFLLVRLLDSPDWVPFRDVYEVDGQRVRDRDDRLVQLFLSGRRDAYDQARRIAQEGARYNVGFFERSENSPLVALGFLQSANAHRFQFKLRSNSSVNEPRLAVVEYSESVKPTLIRGAGNADLPARGRLWIDRETGAVVRTELRFVGPTAFTTITTEFEADGRFPVLMPVRMRESHQNPNGRRVEATATYSHFRRFEVSTEPSISLPP